MSKSDYIKKKVLKNIIAELETGVLPWQRPWKTVGGGLPIRFEVKKPYRGTNVLLLWSVAQERGYTCPYWATYKQVRKMGGKVHARPKDIPKGEWGTSVVYYKFIEKEKPDGTKDHYPMMKRFWVYNIGHQCDGLDVSTEPLPNPIDNVDTADACLIEYFTQSNTAKLNVGYNRASYAPRADVIFMPRGSQFMTNAERISTLFHEIVHSTGHPSRIGRFKLDEDHLFGSDKYSREELIAELGAAFLCAENGVDNAAARQNTAAYLDHWVKALKADPTILFTAASAAQKAVDMIMLRSVDA